MSGKVETVGPFGGGPSQWIAVGPYGGAGGDTFDDGVNTAVRQMIIFTAGSVIWSIQIEYEKNGESIWSDTRGIPNGTKNTVQLDHPNEFLVSVSGTIGLFSSMTIVRSLTIKSNFRTYGPFGTPTGDNTFELSSRIGDKIIGFFGSSGDLVDNIGAYISTQVPQWISVGPFGGKGGDKFDDGINSSVKQMIVFTSDEVIWSIQTEYVKNGRLIWSGTRGISNGTKNTVELDHPNEYLVSVSGTIGLYASMKIVLSLTIKSNMRTYGPFGTRNGTSTFDLSSSNGGKIIGFFGSSGDLLDNIGAYISTQATQ